MILDILVFASLIFMLFINFNPFASIPVFLTLTKDADKKTISSYAFKVILLSAVLLTIFLLVGKDLIASLGISMDGFRVTGGILRLMIAFMVIFELKSLSASNSNTSWTIVATPILIGPGVITTGILLTMHYNVLVILLTGLGALFFIWLLLRYSYIVIKVIGNQGISIIAKVCGILLAAMAVESIFRGLTGWFSPTQIVEIIMMIF